MKFRAKSAVAAIFIIIFSVFFPSILLLENTDTPMKERNSGIHTEAKYTDNIEMKILHDDYLRLENTKEVFFGQKLEQRKNIYRLPVELFVFLIFSLGVCLKRVYLLYIQFYSLPFMRFLREYYTLLEKDGKKRNLAFMI